MMSITILRRFSVMERAQALTDLRALRDQIITVYECSDLCKSYQNEIEGLEGELKHPAPMFFREKPKATYAPLKNKFEKDNYNSLLKESGLKKVLSWVLKMAVIHFRVLL